MRAFRIASIAAHRPVLLSSKHVDAHCAHFRSLTQYCHLQGRRFAVTVPPSSESVISASHDRNHNDDGDDGGNNGDVMTMVDENPTISISVDSGIEQSSTTKQTTTKQHDVDNSKAAQKKSRKSADKNENIFDANQARLLQMRRQFFSKEKHFPIRTSVFSGRCDFVVSCSSIDNIERYVDLRHRRQQPQHTMAEVCFIGRSNVGKSSLINALVGRKDLVKTSKTPVRCRTELEMEILA